MWRIDRCVTTLFFYLRRRVLHLDERSSRCKVYENQSFKHGQSAAFTDCGIRLLREKFLGEWADRFNCTLHYAKSYLGEAGEVRRKNLRKKSVWQIERLFHTIQVWYTTIVQYLHAGVLL